MNIYNLTILLLLHTSDPDWASYKLGVFVCLTCSGIHRSLSSRVKSIKLDYWEDELVEVWTALSCYCCYDDFTWSIHPFIWRCPCVIFVCPFLGSWKFMKANGNASAKALYEKAVPAYYYQPQENDCMWVFFQDIHVLLTWWLAHVFIMEYLCPTITDCWLGIATKIERSATSDCRSEI